MDFRTIAKKSQGALTNVLLKLGNFADGIVLLVILSLLTCIKTQTLKSDYKEAGKNIFRARNYVSSVLET